MGSHVAKNGLTPLQARFAVILPDVDYNATEAYRRAGGNAKNPEQAAYELLRKPHVKAAVQQRVEDGLAAAGVTLDRVIKEWARIAFTNLSDVSTWESGRLALRDMDEMTEDQLAAIAEIHELDSGEDGVPRLSVKMHKKTEGLKELTKLLLRSMPEKEPEAIGGGKVLVLTLQDDTEGEEPDDNVIDMDPAGLEGSEDE